MPSVDENRKIGNYEILEKLGSGSVGTVYKARQLSMDRLVALKILNPKHAQDPEYVRRFIEEAKAAGRVNHPNVCQVYDVGQDRGLYYFSMELVDGPTVEQLLKDRGKLSVPEALNIARQVAMALQAAYMNGLVHRDVKPANILISKSGVAKLVDLGLAKDVAKPSQMELGVAGTPYYMPPEQSQGLEVDIRSDIYALGATLYHMLVGRPPFTGPHATAVIVKHAAEPLTPPSDVDPSIPKRVSAIVARMMAKKPEDRYDTPEELAADLDDAIAGRDSSPRPRRQGPPPARKKLTTGSHVPVKTRQFSLRAYAVPAALGGGVLLAALVLALISFGGDSNIRKADELIAKAQAQLARDTPEALAEASRMAREALGLLPVTTVMLPRRNAAERIRDQADARRAELDIAAMEAVLTEALEGRRDFSEVEAAIASLERRYAQGVPAASRDRVTMACSRARARMTAASTKKEEKKEEKPAVGREPVPAPGSSIADTLKAEAEKFLREENFSQAMELLDVAAAAMGAEDRRTVEMLRKNLLAVVDRAFQKVMEDVAKEVKAGNFEAAEAILRLAKGRFSFAPYDKKIVVELSKIEEKKAAAPGQVEARLTEGIDKAVDLIQEGKKTQAREILQQLQQQYGQTEAFKKRRDEIQALLELAK